MSDFIKDWSQKEFDVLNKSSRRYSIFVFILKFVLPVIALAMLVILVLYPTLSGKKNKIVLVASESKVVNSATPEMLNPKFQGVDSSNQQYQISAKRAIQEKIGFVRMEDMTADITLNNGQWISVIARTGTYDLAKKFAVLNEDVNAFITDKDGATYQVSGSEVNADMSGGIIQSAQPVKAKGPMGNFSAASFYADRATQKITFQGPVKLTIVK